MEDITLTLDEETAAWVRERATRRKKSVSCFVGELLQEKVRQWPGSEEQEYEEAMLRYFAIKPRNLSDGKPYPKREELYDRKILR